MRGMVSCCLPDRERLRIQSRSLDLVDVTLGPYPLAPGGLRSDATANTPGDPPPQEDRKKPCAGKWFNRESTRAVTGKVMAHAFLAS